MPSRPSSIRGKLINVAVAFAATLALLTLLEIVLRVAAYVGDQKILSESIARRPPLRPDSDANLADIIRLSPNERIIYELIPNLRATFMGAPLSTNRHGFRGRDIQEARPPDSVRIVGLGDSIMFGWGVRDQDSYLAFFARRLNELHPQKHWEAVNTAVPGYNTVMEVETLITKGLLFEPDLVVVGFCGNDMNLPYFIRDREEYFSFRKSFLTRFVRDRLTQDATNDDTLESDMGLARWTAPNREAWDGFASSKAKREVPARYADMVGLAAFTRALEELRRLGVEKGFDVAVVFFPTARRRAAAIAMQQGFMIANTRFAVEAFMSEHGIKAFPGSALTIGPDDPHPSVTGHALIADVLFDAVARAHWIDRHSERQSANAPGR